MDGGPHIPASRLRAGQAAALSWSSWLRASEPADPSDALRQEVAGLYETHRAEIHGFLVHTRCRAEDAEEITQEAFLRLYRVRVAGKRVDAPRSWLFAVARNIAIDRARRRKQHRLISLDEGFGEGLERLASDAPTGEDVLLARNRRAALAGALADLTDLQRECLHLRAHGLPLREIGAIVGVSVWGVSDAVRRAVRRLQKGIDERA